ncbi:MULTISPECIES: VG15 protein [Streptomyces]|uniref:VG15 protein n=1 Tax=Streptomyces TaxID=1883 RepID=UPI00160119D7|nr:hypothetical protein [Streptomyces murinus]MBA9050780.1 hypothetical protein [Streptomyces murinus]
MPTSEALALARYKQTQGLARSVLTAVQGFWGEATPDRILAAMQGEVGRGILNAVVAGQLNAAEGAQAFVSSAMLAQGARATLLGQVVPGSFAGLASDGRSLATLLFLPALTVARAFAGGIKPAEAMTLGLNQMASIVSTQITDASRVSTSVAMTAHPRCVSYVRVVRLPACARCIILAGRQYSHSEGFKRHPRCDCGMEPLSDSEWREAPDPKSLFEQMSPEERHKRFGAAGVDALNNGADMSQVVNARRGMSTTATGKKVSTEGTTRRGIAGKAMGDGFAKSPGQRYMRSKSARLMPEQILSQAKGDRDLQISLLRRYGYIT